MGAAHLRDGREDAEEGWVMPAVRHVVGHDGHEVVVEELDELVVAPKHFPDHLHALHATVEALHEQVQMLVHLFAKQVQRGCCGGGGTLAQQEHDKTEQSTTRR